MIPLRWIIKNKTKLTQRNKKKKNKFIDTEISLVVAKVGVGMGEMNEKDQQVKQKFKKKNWGFFCFENIMKTNLQSFKK